MALDIEPGKFYESHGMLFVVESIRNDKVSIRSLNTSALMRMSVGAFLRNFRPAAPLATVAAKYALA